MVINNNEDDKNDKNKVVDFEYKNFWKPRVDGMRIFSPTIQFGQVLQVITISGTIITGIFAAGQWVNQIRSDIRELRGDVKEETAARQLAESNLNKSLIAQQEASKAIVESSNSQRSVDAGIQQEFVKVMDTLGRFDRTYQRFFAISQPQPLQRKQP